MDKLVHTCHDDDCHCDEGLDMNDVSFEEITSENLTTVMKLNVSELQKKFVAPNSVSIAQGHYSDTAWFRAICYEKLPVGFIMIDDNEKLPEYFLWRFMIDDRYQGFGIGKKALELAIEYVKTRPDAKEFLTSCVPGEGSPLEFYKKLGFEETGEVSEGELVLKLTFS
jgi:diamine N-acetyltransferase